MIKNTPAGGRRQEPPSITPMFPTPVWIKKRDSNLTSEEKKEIEEIIKEGMCKFGVLDQRTKNTYIFDTKLKNLKEFTTW